MHWGASPTSPTAMRSSKSSSSCNRRAMDCEVGSKRSLRTTVLFMKRASNTMSIKSVSRRKFLHGAGVTFSLPLLDAFASRTRAGEPAAPPRRFLAVCATLGFHAPYFFPTKAGRDYELTPYLEFLKQHRENFTVFSGVSHPEVDGGHFAEASFLTAAPHPKASSFKNTISLDQYIVEKTAPDTRFPFLTLSTRSGSLSWTAGGVTIPAENSPSKLFRRMF